MDRGSSRKSSCMYFIRYHNHAKDRTALYKPRSHRISEPCKKKETPDASHQALNLATAQTDHMSRCPITQQQENQGIHLQFKSAHRPKPFFTSSRTFCSYSGRRSRHIFAASTFAGLSSLGSASMLMTDRRIFSTLWMGDQRSEACS